MSNSTSLIDQIAVNQSNKEAVANGNFDAASPAMLWGRRASTTNLLTWGYYGGYYNGNAIADSTLTLVASATNYVYASATTGTVSVNQSGFPSAVIQLYSIVANATTVTSYTDFRSYQPNNTLPSQPFDLPFSYIGTMTGAQALANILFSRPVTFPVSLSTSPTPICGAAPTGTVSISLSFVRAGSVVASGTVNFAAAATTGTLTFTTAFTTQLGDVLQIAAPSVADGTFASPSFTLTGTR